jgi:hypothetical protein
VRREFRHAPDGVLDIAALVAAGDDDARREFAVRERDHRPGHEIGAQAQLPDARQRRDVFVDQRSKAEQTPRHELPLLLADHLEIGEVHQVEEVDGGDVVDLGLAALQSEDLAELEDRLPQTRIVGDDDPGGWRAKPVDAPERFVDVLEHPDGIGDHDIVEGALDRRKRRLILHVAQHEVELRVAPLRLRDGLGTEVDADAVGWRKRGKRIAPAAAEFKHALSRRDQEPHEPGVFGVVLRVARTLARLIIQRRFDMFQEFALAPAQRLRRRNGDGIALIHSDLVGIACAR